jgi:Zn-dependent protease
MLDISITRILLWLPAVLIALTFHEYAHAKVADSLGDPTARYMGRMTLNPLVHIDPLGFILLIVAGFGWAKPVQVNPLNFRGDRLQGMMKVSAAGPLMNLFVAFTALLILNFALPGAQAYSNAILVQIMWATPLTGRQFSTSATSPTSVPSHSLKLDLINRGTA